MVPTAMSVKNDPSSSRGGVKARRNICRVRGRETMPSAESGRSGIRQAVPECVESRSQHGAPGFDCTSGDNEIPVGSHGERRERESDAFCFKP
jgi:hypothetical protein